MYHGTTNDNGQKIEMEGIQLAYSQEYLDFSKGFYTTPNMTFALRTANKRLSTSKHFPGLYQNISGIAIVILEYNEARAQQELRLKHFEKPTNKWAQFIAANRVRSDDSVWADYDNNRLQQYDIVDGPTADGTVLLNEVLTKIASGDMQINQVKSKMCMLSQSANWGTQVSFHSSNALSCIKIKNVLYLDGGEG